MRLIRIMTDTMNTIPITIHFIINFLPDRCGDLPWLPTIICKYLCETKYTCISIRYDIFMHPARAILIVTGVLFLFFSYSPYWFWGSLQWWSSWGPIRKSLKKNCLTGTHMVFGDDTSIQYGPSFYQALPLAMHRFSPWCVLAILGVISFS